jgi:Tfp pilus assembly protein PilF
MKTKSGLCITLCGSMLMGCSSLNDGSLAFWKTPPTIVMTADSEYQRGRQLHRMGQYAEAQKAYLGALAIDPQHAEASNGIAALIGASGDLDRAIGMLVELSARHPKSHVFANLGHAYQLRGRTFEAHDAYQRAVDIDPGNEHARGKLAALAQQLGATAVAEAPGMAETVVVEPDTGAIDLVARGVYAMRYPSASPGMSATVAADQHGSPVEALPAAASLMPADSPAVPGAGYQVDAKHAPARALTVELVNGNGVNGLARQLKAWLPANEWRVVRTANHSDFWVRQTRIEYVQPHKPAAQRLADDIGVRPALRPNSELTGTRLRVVLGHDCKDLDSLRQRLATAKIQPAS